MSTYKLLIEEKNFPEDLVFTLKVLSLNSAQKDLSDTLLIYPHSSAEIKRLLEKEKLTPKISHKLTRPDRQIKYVFIIRGKSNGRKKLSVDSLHPGTTLIYTAFFPCPQNLQALPYFNAAASKTKNYSLT